MMATIKYDFSASRPKTFGIMMGSVVATSPSTIKDIIPDLSEIVPYFYESIKNDEYEEIIDSFLRGAEEPHEEFPILFHMGGIPGSGKSTYYTNNSGKFSNYVLLAFDRIMEKIDGYRRDNEKYGSVESFRLWEIPARVIGYELLFRSIRKRLNIFFDHSGLCKPHISLLKNLRNYDYRTKMCFIECDLDIACSRTLEREKITHRHTPRNLLEERFRLAKSYLNSYREIVDDFMLINS